MTENQVLSHIQNSRILLRAIKQDLMRLQAQAPKVFLAFAPEYARLGARQAWLETQASLSQRSDTYLQRHDMGQGLEGLGLWPLLIGSGVVISLGAVAYKQWQDAKLQKEILECIKKHEEDFIAAGMNAREAAEKAATICRGEDWTGKIFSEGKNLVIWSLVGLGVYYLLKK